jgi:hypothetical protein
MKTKILVLALLIGVIPPTGYCMPPSEMAIPTRTGRLTQLSEAKFIDLSKVAYIAGEIHIAVQGKDRVFPLSKNGQQEASGYLKEVLKNPPDPHVGTGYIPATPSVSTCIRFDERIHNLFGTAENPTKIDFDRVDKAVAESIT